MSLKKIKVGELSVYNLGLVIVLTHENQYVKTTIAGKLIAFQHYNQRTTNPAETMQISPYGNHSETTVWLEGMGTEGITKKPEVEVEVDVHD